MTRDLHDSQVEVDGDPEAVRACDDFFDGLHHFPVLHLD